MIRFFRVRSRQEVLHDLQRFRAVGEEEVSLWDALGRVLSMPIKAEEDLPAFPRATMDGFAVRAQDSFGASEALPGLFRLVGEVRMGEPPPKSIGSSEAMRVATGGMLPPGSDAVVMLEHCEVMDSDTLEVYRSVAPWENVVRPGEDVASGQELFPSGWVLRPQDLGLLAAMGTAWVRVHKKPVVAVLSTGDEVVAVEQRPAQGQVRDVNGISVCALVAWEGATPLPMGIVPDNQELLRQRLLEALDAADAVIVSGGSSVGTRDFILEVLQGLDESQLLAHGVAVRPGKPTVVAQVNGKPVLGLPGHPVSALVIMHLFGKPLLDRLSGRIYSHRPRPVRARITRNLASAQGREDYVRVVLEQKGEELWARPILGASGLIGTLARADGLVRIDPGCEGIYSGEMVEVESFP